LGKSSPIEIHRRITGSFQASPAPKVSEVPLQAGGEIRNVGSRWNMTTTWMKKNLKDVISIDSID